MALPSYFGLGFTAEDAVRVRDLVAEAAPYCAQCARILDSMERQLAVLNGTPLPEPAGACGSC